MPRRKLLRTEPNAEPNITLLWHCTIWQGTEIEAVRATLGGTPSQAFSQCRR
jgi:hypothetical protein